MDRPQIKRTRRGGALHRSCVGAIRACLSLAAVVLASGVAAGQDIPAPRRSTADDPPPIERLLDPPGLAKHIDSPLDSLPRVPPKFDRFLTCEHSDAMCGLWGLVARNIYAGMRRCWQPPDWSRIETSFLFGQAANAAKAPDRAERVISIKIELAPDGKLEGAPRSTSSNIPAAQIDGVIRAIERCQPYEVPPSSTYKVWKDVLLRIRIGPKPLLEAPSRERLPIDPGSYRG
jgi:hypothetical protein